MRTVAKNRSILPRPCGRRGRLCTRRMPRAGHCSKQLGADERRAVVDIHGFGDAPRRQRVAQRRLQAHGVLRQTPPIADQRTGPIVDEGEQIRLATIDLRPVQGVAGPQVVGIGGLEPAEGLRRCRVGPHVQPEPNEQTLHRALRRAITLGGPNDLGDLGGRPLRCFALEPLGEFQLGWRRDRLAMAHRGGQRLEPAHPISADPTIDRVAGHPHPSTARPGVIPRSQLADQLAPLGVAQLRVSSLPDERVTEKGDLSLTVVHQ